jgi:hypothetical protein
MHGFDGGDKEGTVATGHLAVGSLAEVVTTPDDVVELHLSLGQGEVLGRLLLGKILSCGMSTTSPVRTGVRHVIYEVAVMTGNTAVPCRVA